MTVWVLWLTLRAHALATPLILLVTAAALSIATSLSWLASTLLTDIFAGVAVLALYLVTLRAETLSALGATGADRPDRILGRNPHRDAGGAARIARGGRCVVAAGPARQRAVHRAGAKPPSPSSSASRCCSPPISPSPAGSPGRRAAARSRSAACCRPASSRSYLAEHCPDPRLPKLCANREKLPDNADFFFWGSDLFNELGRFEGLGEEMRIVVRESLAAYPAAQLKAALAATASSSCASRPATASTPRSGTRLGRRDHWRRMRSPR